MDKKGGRGEAGNCILLFVFYVVEDNSSWAKCVLSSVKGRGWG